MSTIINAQHNVRVGHEKCIDILLKAGADIGIVGKDGSALDVAHFRYASNQSSKQLIVSVQGMLKGQWASAQDGDRKSKRRTFISAQRSPLFQIVAEYVLLKNAIESFLE